MRERQANYHIYGLHLSSDYAFRTPLAKAKAKAKAESAGAAGASFASTSSAGTVRFGCRVVPVSRSLTASDRIYASDEKNPQGESATQLYISPPVEIVRYPRVADFMLTPGSIDCEVTRADFGYLVEICLLGDVLTYYSERLGRSAIHSGAVAADGRAVLFVADSTVGKSTMVASLVRAGLPLLADDIAVLESERGQTICHRGYPQLKMNEEQVRAFTRSAGHEEFSVVHPAFDKVGVPAERVGIFADRPLPVGAIYILQRNRATEAPIAIEAVGPMEALMNLIRNSFVSELVDATDLRSERLSRLSRIVKTTPVRRLSYPTGYDALPAVHRAVLDDLDRDLS
ncbi:MAG: hypothetical protein ACOC2Q_04240 [Spirochaetota bacterium]